MPSQGGGSLTEAATSTAAMGMPVPAAGAASTTLTTIASGNGSRNSGTRLVLGAGCNEGNWSSAGSYHPDSSASYPCQQRSQQQPAPGSVATGLRQQHESGDVHSAAGTSRSSSGKEADGKGGSATSLQDAGSSLTPNTGNSTSHSSPPLGRPTVPSPVPVLSRAQNGSDPLGATGTSGTSMTPASAPPSPGTATCVPRVEDPLSSGSASGDSLESSLIPPGSALSHLPSYIRQLLIKGRVSSTPCYLSPYRCVLTRHPVHRDSTESHINSLVAKIREEGYNEALAAQAPLVAVRYSKPQTLPTRAAGSTRATVYDNWSDHPLVYAIAGGGRGEAVAQLVQSSTKSTSSSQQYLQENNNSSYCQGGQPASHVPLEDSAAEDDHPSGGPSGTVQPRALAFYLLNAGENLSGWEIFLLSTALNACDPYSRPPNYFERTDQIAFICLELSRRKQADALCRDIAIEICSNPFLSELRSHLQLTPSSVIPLQSLTDTQTPAEILQQLIQSRTIFPWLPPNTGVLPHRVPLHQLEILDVMIDMATCVNAKKMKHVSPAALRDIRRQQTGRGGSGSTAARANATPDPSAAKAEGFLHAVAEDQLRYLFRQIVPVDAGATFDVLVIRDLVSVVFGAIQECSRQFRQSVAVRKTTETDAEISGSPPPESLATSPAAGAYWVERIVYEATAGGLLAGLWNFPAAALVVLFYIYFVNQIQTFHKEDIQDKLLKVGTTLYRCIAELALTLRASKITLMTAPTSVQIRILEGASILFRLALFGVVHVECFPPHPFSIPVEALNCSSNYCNLTNTGTRSTDSSSASLTEPTQQAYDVRTFIDFDLCYEFLYSFWFKGLIAARLPPTQDYRHVAPSAATLAPSATPPTPSAFTGTRASSDTSLTAGSSSFTRPDANTVQSVNVSRRRPWYEARRIEVAATANRLRQEVEAIMNQRNAGGIGSNERIQVRRVPKRPSSMGVAHGTPSSQERATDLVEVEILDPSVLPMAHSAKVEFQSLVQGVVTMLIERHRCWDAAASSSGTFPNGKTQFLSVPANMVILAAIKVALTFISPHFDRLAPHLVHWISVRCRLILWIWRECRAEVTRRAEERWDELWMKHHPHGPAAPRLKIRFTSMQRADGHYVDLTAAKLGEVVLGVLPGVLDSMVAFYEQRENVPDDTVAREFFAKWLRSAGDSDLVAQVNTLLAQPLSLTKAAQISNEASSGYATSSATESLGGSSSSSGLYQQAHHLVKRARQDGSSGLTDPAAMGPCASYPSSSASGGGVAASSPPSLATSASALLSSTSQPVVLSSNRTSAAPYLASVTAHRTGALDSDRGGKKSKKTGSVYTRNGIAGDGADDFVDWLDGLPYAERLRLDGQEVPQWELPRVTLVPAPDLLRWRPPEILHPFLGNGLKGPSFDLREWRRFRLMEQYRAHQQRHPRSSNVDNSMGRISGTSPYSSDTVIPLSDLDWKITAGVLKLLRSRGVDTLVSRGRGKVFFLDEILSYSESIGRQIDAAQMDWDQEDDEQQQSSSQLPLVGQHDDEDDVKKRDVSHPLSAVPQKKRKGQTGSLTAQRRYGAGFFKSTDPLSIPPQERLTDRIPDLDSIRSFLEYDALFDWD